MINISLPWSFIMVRLVKWHCNLRRIKKCFWYMYGCVVERWLVEWTSGLMKLGLILKSCTVRLLVGIVQRHTIFTKMIQTIDENASMSIQGQI